jgi:two-component system phosphate regulon sensor histidine kinase PhoR
VNLPARLVTGTILVLVAAMAVLVWASEVSLRRDLEKDLASALEREARVIAAALPGTAEAQRDAVHRFSRENGHRITLIDTAGRVIAESDAPDAALNAIGNHADRPEVKAALATGTGHDLRRSATFGAPLLYVAVRSPLGVLRVAAPYAQVDDVVRRAQTAVLSAALLALIAGTVLALLTGRNVARPLTDIGQAARAIAAGGTPRFPHSGIPDVDALVQALRQMHAQLGERFEQLRHERAEVSAVLEAMVEGVIATDGKGRIVTANAAAHRLLGYAPEATLPELPQLFRARPAREVVDAVLAGEVVAGRQLELEDRTVLASGRPLPQGGAVLVFHDLTDLRRLEAVRRDFVANVSHELKTPLTSISGYAETLLDDRPDPETSARFLEVILGNARRMQRLVDSLLDLSRIESGSWSPKVEAVSVGAVTRETWAGLAARATQRKVEFAVDTDHPAPVEAFVDPDALRQVLTNLLDNALRYTPAGGRITARARHDDEGVTVSVSDTGSGIGSEHLPRIFERFYRADPSRSRDEGGTGLGLSIVKHLVEAHGGRVWATSELGRGTTINAWFPTTPVAQGVA